MLARFGGHAAEDAGHGGLRAALGLVVRLVVADRLEQQIVLDLVVVAGRPLMLPDQVLGPSACAPCRCAGGWPQPLPTAEPLRAVDHVAAKAPATGDVAALDEHPRAVGKRVFHGIMVEHLIGLGADLTPPLPLGRHRPGVLYPAANVNVMDQPVQKEAPIEPGVTGVVADLVGQLAHAGRLRRKAGRVVLAIGPGGNDLADGAVVDAANRLLQRRIVATHQAAGDFEVLLGRCLARLEHAANARPIHGERLLHEHVATLGHGVFDMHRAERPAAWPAGPGRPAPWHRWPSGSRPCRGIAAPGSRRLFAELFREGFAAGLEAVLEDVGHGPELRRPLRGKRVGGGARAAAAAADQGDLDGIVLSRVAARRIALEQGRAGQRRAGSLQELAAGG